MYVKYLRSFFRWSTTRASHCRQNDSYQVVLRSTVDYACGHSFATARRQRDSQMTGLFVVARRSTGCPTSIRLSARDFCSSAWRIGNYEPVGWKSSKSPRSTTTQSISGRVHFRHPVLPAFRRRFSLVADRFEDPSNCSALRRRTTSLGQRSIYEISSRKKHGVPKKCDSFWGYQIMSELHSITI